MKLIKWATLISYDSRKNAQLHLEQALNMEEIYCQQITKVKWHSDEDGNIAYFHKVAKINNASSLITSM
jgi:hypothetical protein